MLDYYFNEELIKYVTGRKIADQRGLLSTIKKVYEAYVKFCDHLNLEAETQRKLTTRLKGLGVEDGRKNINGKKIRCYLGIKLK